MSTTNSLPENARDSKFVYPPASDGKLSYGRLQSQTANMSPRVLRHDQESQGTFDPQVLPQQSVHAKNTPATTTGAAMTPPRRATKRVSGFFVTAIKKICCSILSLKNLFWGVFVFVFTAYITLTAKSLDGILSSISATNGIILLNILGLLNNYALTALADDLWEKIQWGPLLKRGEPLLTFMTLSSGWNIWWKTLFRWGSGPKKQHPRWWSFGRIVAWGFLQFPSIIIMTLLNPETSYKPVQWTAISGGVGVFDPAFISGFPGGPQVATLVQTALQDGKTSFVVDATSDNCQSSSSSCSSFLIPGGPLTVSPWPYKKLNDTSLSAYITKDGPAYQIDVWEAPQVLQWSQDSCRIYAADSQSAFKFCVSSLDGTKNQLIAGWVPCLSNVLSSGECNITGSWNRYPMTMTYLSIFRRTATVAASRETSVILNVDDLSYPIPQSITAKDFLTAFDSLLIVWSDKTYQCRLIGPDFKLTLSIYSTLMLSLAAPEVSLPLDWLRNLFATTLLLSTPFNNGAGLAIDNVQPNLLAENYINGSYAIPVEHIVPQLWIAIVFTACEASALILIFIGLVFSHMSKGPDTSSFPFLNTSKLRWERIGRQTNPGVGIEGSNLNDLFIHEDLSDDSKILKEAADIKVFWNADVNKTKNEA